MENIHRINHLKNMVNNLSFDPKITLATMNSEEFWISVNFLIKNERNDEALQLFDEMRLKSPSLCSSSNFSKMGLLLSSSSSSAIPQVFSLLSSMSNLNFPVPLSLYNSLLLALSKEKQFDEMGKLIKKMKLSGSNPNSATFNILIMEFGKAGLLRKMESAHRSILSLKMNLLPSSIEAMIRAYADVSDIPKMEKMYRRLLSSSVVRSRHAMVDNAYNENGGLLKMENRISSSISGIGDLGELSKMGKTYWRSSSSLPLSSSSSRSELVDLGKLPKMRKMHQRSSPLLPSSSSSLSSSTRSGLADLGQLPKMGKMYSRSSSLSSSSSCGFSEDLIRKMAMVYIQNLMFSRLEDLGNDLAARKGRTSFVCLLLLLASGLILSRRGMDSIIKELRSSMIEDDISFINILAMAHARMKGFKDLEVLFLMIGENGDLKPDLITVSVFFDACSCGFHGGRVLDAWKRKGFLERKVEMVTDSLVIAGFGKGQFLESCEEILFEDNDDNDRDNDDGKIKKKEWTYVDLIGQLFLKGKLSS